MSWSEAVKFVHPFVDVLGELFQLFRSDFFAAHRTRWVVLDPMVDALGVEIVVDIARKR